MQFHCPNGEKCIKFSCGMMHLCQNGIMRITVDIDESMLNELSALTGESKKSPAIAKAVQDYVYRSKARDFGFMLRTGAFDYDVLNEEQEAAQDTTSASEK
jgi:metal-responsive CopG/Arc/MetJ family transcriptional regulator